MDSNDALILRWFVDFIPNMTKVEEKGITYHWVKYQVVIDDLPILNITNRNNMARRFEKLVKLGILDKHVHKDSGNFTTFRLTEKYKILESRAFAPKVESTPQKGNNLVRTDEPSTESNIGIAPKVERYRPKGREGIAPKVETKDKSIKDSSINSSIRPENNNYNNQDFSQFDFSLFMSGDEKKDIDRRNTLLRILKRNYKQAEAVGTSYLDFVVSIQSHLYDRYKKGEDIFAAINNTISSGIKTIIAPKEPYVQLTPEERKKQKEEQLKKEERNNILSNYCIGVTYDEAMAQLNKDKKDRMRHFPFRPQEVITKVECDRYKIKYPTKRQWEIFNTEKEKYLLKAGGFTEGDCK